MRGESRHTTITWEREDMVITSNNGDSQSIIENNRTNSKQRDRLQRKIEGSIRFKLKGQIINKQER